MQGKFSITECLQHFQIKGDEQENIAKKKDKEKIGAQSLGLQNENSAYLSIAG